MAGLQVGNTINTGYSEFCLGLICDTTYRFLGDLSLISSSETPPITPNAPIIDIGK